MEGVMSVYAERTTGATYFEVVPDREKTKALWLELRGYNWHL